MASLFASINSATYSTCVIYTRKIIHISENDFIKFPLDLNCFAILYFDDFYR